MSPRDEAEIKRMQRELVELRRAVANIPVRWPSTQTYTRFSIQKGNTLISTPVVEYGVKNTFTVLTAVPTAAPDISTTYADGLGWGQPWLSDGTVGSNAWIYNGPVNPGSGTVTGGISSYVPQGTVAWVANIISIPITGGGGTTALVYQLYKVA